MTTPVHLLRPFTGWWWQLGPRKGEDITSVDDAIAWVEMIFEHGFDRFYTTTARRPKRLIEAGPERYGSVYFCKRGETLFSMPIKEIEVGDLETDIIMKPIAFRCAPKRVGMVRGWRYLEDADAPADTPHAGDKPPEFYEVVGDG